MKDDDLDIPEPQLSDMERKVRAIDALPISVRDLLMSVAGDLVDLTEEQLEFAEIVVRSMLADGKRSLDPMPICAVACAKWRSRRRQN